MRKRRSKGPVMAHFNRKMENKALAMVALGFEQWKLAGGNTPCRILLYDKKYGKREYSYGC